MNRLPVMTRLEKLSPRLDKPFRPRKPFAPCSKAGPPPSGQVLALDGTQILAASAAWLQPMMRPAAGERRE